MLRIHAGRTGTLVALFLGVAGATALADDPETSPNDETESDNHVVESVVHFEFDSTALSDEARAELDKAAEWIRQNQTGLILIEGHADKVGKEPYNKDLATRRADSARTYL